jgi:hypothetical protein
MKNLGVAIVTNGRCPELLGEIVDAWDRRNVEVSIRLNEDRGLFADDVRKAMSNLSTPYVLVGADDILPVGEWPGHWRQAPKTIQGVRLLDVEGRRYFDWALWEDGRGLRGLQAYDSPENPMTYITGNAQVWSREARELVPWPDGGPRSCDDIRACRQAQALGVSLLAPAMWPVLIHLERRYPA